MADDIDTPTVEKINLVGNFALMANHLPIDIFFRLQNIEQLFSRFNIVKTQL